MCKHGRAECAGNVHELCVAKYTGKSSTWWPFLRCLNQQGLERIGLDETAAHCAKVAKIDWVDSGVETCVTGPEGPRLLRESVEHSQKLGIQLSDIRSSVYPFPFSFSQTPIWVSVPLRAQAFAYTPYFFFRFRI